MHVTVTGRTALITDVALCLSMRIPAYLNYVTASQGGCLKDLLLNLSQPSTRTTTPRSVAPIAPIFVSATLVHRIPIMPAASPAGATTQDQFKGRVEQAAIADRWERMWASGLRPGQVDMAYTLMLLKTMQNTRRRVSFVRARGFQRP